MRTRPVAEPGGRVYVALAAIAALTVGAVLSAARPAQQQPVFRDRTDLVRVDVVVTDSRDRPITDLTIDEFEIAQNGRRQQITDFEFVSIANASRSLDVEGVVPPPPDVATNEPPPDNSRAFVMVIDDRHLLPHDIVPTKRVMTDFLEALQPNDEVAMVFVGRSDLSTDFTSDVGRLLKSVDAVREVFGFGIGAWQPPNVELTRMGPGQGRAGLHPEEFHYLQQTMEALHNVTRSLSSSRHVRRALVFVSAGFNFDPVAADRLERGRGTEMMLEMLGLYDVAARSNVPVYTLDPRGLVSPYMAVEDPLALGDSNSGWPPERRVQEVERRIRLQNDRMAEIAINTGGRAFIKQSNLTAAVDQIVADNGHFYLLGYYPEPYQADGQYHEIGVKVTRPGARVRARQGYVAPTPAGEIVTADVSFAETLAQGLPSSGLQLRALATPLGAGVEGRVTTGVTVQVTYDSRDAAAGVPDEQLRFAILALDPDARIRTSTDQTFSFSLPPNASGPMTMEINHVVDLPRGPSALRLGVASRATGRTGTVHLPIDLPDLREGQLALGGMVLGHPTSANRPRIASPAFQALLPFPPTITREFDTSDALAVFVRVFPPPGVAGDLQTALTISRDGEVLQAAAVRCVPSTPTTGALDCLANVPLNNLTPNIYALTFAARLGSGNPISRAIPFTVR